MYLIWFATTHQFGMRFAFYSDKYLERHIILIYRCLSTLSEEFVFCWNWICVFLHVYHITFVRSKLILCLFFYTQMCIHVDDWWDPQFIPYCIWPLFSCLLFSRNVLLRFLSNTYWDKICPLTPILGPPDFLNFLG